MATRYIDAAAGNDSGSGTSILSPWRTLEYAFTNSVSGDVWIINGTFINTLIGASNFLSFSSPKSLTIRSLTPYSGIIVASANQVFTFTTGFGTSTITLGDIVFGGLAQGGVRAQYVLRCNTNAGMVMRTIPGAGPKFLETPTIATFYFAAGTGCKIDAQLDDVIFDTPESETVAATGRLIETASGLLAGSRLVINRMTGSIRKCRHDGALFYINCADSEIPIQINDCVLYTKFSGSVTTQALIFDIINSNRAEGNRNALTMTTDIASGTNGIALRIRCESLTLTAHHGRLDSNITYMDMHAGIHQLIGTDASGLYDNRANYGLISNSIAIGSDRFKAGLGHGPTIGNQTGGVIEGGSSDNNAIGGLLKQGIDCTIINMTFRRCSLYAVYFKGGSNPRAANNNIYQAASDGPAFDASAGDTASPNIVNGIFSGNRISVSGAAGRVINVRASQEVNIGPNSFYIAAGATISNPAITLAGVDYATLQMGVDASSATSTITQNAAAPLTGTGRLVYGPNGMQVAA